MKVRMITKNPQKVAMRQLKAWLLQPKQQKQVSEPLVSALRVSDWPILF